MSQRVNPEREAKTKAIKQIAAQAKTDTETPTSPPSVFIVITGHICGQGAQHGLVCQCHCTCHHDTDPPQPQHEAAPSGQDHDDTYQPSEEEISEPSQGRQSSYTRKL